MPRDIPVPTALRGARASIDNARAHATIRAPQVCGGPRLVHRATLRQRVCRRRPIVTPETNPPSMRPYGRQILICEHGDCAPPEAAQRLAAHFRTLARGHGLTTLRNPQRVKCTLSGCLGVCAGGPILVVYPDGTWYHHVDDALLERIITEHLLDDRPVEAHIFHRLGAEESVPPDAAPPVYAPDYSGDDDAADQAP